MHTGLLKWIGQAGNSPFLELKRIAQAGNAPFMAVVGGWVVVKIDTGNDTGVLRGVGVWNANQVRVLAGQGWALLGRFDQQAHAGLCALGPVWVRQLDWATQRSPL